MSSLGECQKRVKCQKAIESWHLSDILQWNFSVKNATQDSNEYSQNVLNASRIFMEFWNMDIQGIFTLKYT